MKNAPVDICCMEQRRMGRSALRRMSFERALRQLQSAILEVEASAEENELTLKEEGMIQRFEYCFELGWKLMKDLAWEGASRQVKSPKGAIAWAFRNGLVENAEVWGDMLSSRNLTSHVYDFHEVQPVLKNIKGPYLEAFNGLLATTSIHRPPEPG
jgi:nucleotidyltransferase substrate binding protein (TIGR01987 family)